MPLAGPTHANACASRPRSRTTACTSCGLGGVGGDPQPGGGRAEAEPGEPGAQPVPQLPLGLRDRHAEHQPAAVPGVPLAHEAVDPPGALLEQLGAGRGQLPQHPAAVPRWRRAAPRSPSGSRAWRADFSSTPEAAEGLEQGRGPHRRVPRVHELAEHGQQQRAGAGGADLAAARGGDAGSVTALLRSSTVGGRSGDRRTECRPGADGPPGMIVDKLLTIYRVKRRVLCTTPATAMRCPHDRSRDTPGRPTSRRPPSRWSTSTPHPDRYRHWTARRRRRRRHA